MTPTAIYTAVRDALIAAALGFILWYVHHADGNAAKVADLEGVEKQLTANAAQVAAWQKESIDANAQRASELAQVRSDIAAHSAPVYVMRNVPPGPGALPGAAAAARCPAPQGGGADAGPRGDLVPVDVRPELERFELKYEAALANCRAILNQWPEPESSP